jgi:hypothetical protein
MAQSALDSAKGAIISEIQQYAEMILNNREVGIKMASCGCSGSPWEPDVVSHQIKDVCPPGSQLTGTFNTDVSTVLTVDNSGGKLVVKPTEITSQLTNVHLDVCAGTGGNFYNQTQTITNTIITALNASVSQAIVAEADSYSVPQRFQPFPGCVAVCAATTSLCRC